MSGRGPVDPTAELPFALGGPAGRGALRRSPEDFEVEEVTGFEPSGSGEHAWLVIRKRGANTLWVARQLARLAGVRPDAVGFAGLKDRAALTTQAFTVHLPGRPRSRLVLARRRRDRVLAVQRHHRKLRRGTLRGNRFRIRVAALSRRRGGRRRVTRPDGCGRGAQLLWPAALRSRRGKPGAGRVAARRGATTGDGSERGLALSAARSWLFNGVLAERVRDASWGRGLPGDVMQLDGRRALFRIDEPDAETERRCAAGDIHPTGPLPGRDAPSAVVPGGKTARLEEECLGRHAGWVPGLVRQGLESDRRALRVMPRELAWEWDGDALELSFFLTAGAFATALLRELVRADGATSADDDLA